MNCPDKQSSTINERRPRISASTTLEKEERVGLKRADQILRLILLVSFTALCIGCGTKTIVTKKYGLQNAMQSGPIDKDGLVINVQPVTELNLEQHPQVAPTFNVETKDGKFDVQWTVATLPAFRVKITNNNDHILKLNTATWKLIDGNGNVFDAISKADLRAANKASLSQADLEAALPTIEDTINQLSLLNPNAEVLPGYSKTFYAAFQLPRANTMEEHRSWMEKHPELTFSIFDLVTETDEAGEVARKTKIEVPFKLNVTEEKKTVRTLF